MRITIIGVGNMGRGLAKQLAKAGHQVTVSARDPDKARAVADEFPGVTSASADQALGSSDLIVVATGYEDAVPALRSLGDLTGKIVLDITNPMAPDFMSLTLGHSTSAAEEIAKAVPGAEVVKAFNTVFAQIVADGPEVNGRRVSVFYATDSDRAREAVRELIQSTGFLPVDAGPLKNARYLEPLAGLNIYFGYGAGHGTAVAPSWIGIE